MSLAGKLALITGASRGIGLATLLRLAQEGATVVGTATTQTGADLITEKLAASNYKGRAFVVDVTDQATVETMLIDLQLDHGPPAILVNNAGITRDNLLLRMSDTEWQQVMDTNLTSVFRLTKACLKGMLKARWGRIINISSVVASSGAGGQVNYSAAKAGIIGFSKSLAQEIASRNITVNVITPGFVETDMTRSLSEEQRQEILKKVPIERMGRAEDIAAAVAFLASDDASYITGATLPVNGGLYMA